ncbi:MAG: hypothetical protein WBP45_10105 [Daejeonella sp.]
MDIQKWPFRLKSARRKKRLQKKDFDKQLIQFDKLEHVLWEKKDSLPMIPLEQPYQKGWKRFFVLRDDVKRSPAAEFYQDLLDKINTVEYNHDKTFKRKKKRKRRNVYERKMQTLREFDEYGWNHPKLDLSEAERACFYVKESWCNTSKKMTLTYACREAWRFTLVVKPHIIYEVKMMDEVLEQEIKALENYLERNHLRPKIEQLTKGRSYYRWFDWDFKNKKQFNELKNTTRYFTKEGYLD